MESSVSKIIQWIVDTRPLWPVDDKLPPREQVQELKTAASKALDLINEDEKDKVLHYFFIRDAKMSLASHLLKHFAISTLCSVPWALANSTHDVNHKPIYLAEDPTHTLEFNISHQAGLVVMVACPGRAIALGTDVVCVNERGDYARIERDGFFDFVDMHADVFAESEIQFLKLSPDFLNLPMEMVGLNGYGRDVVSRCQHRGQKLTWKDRDEGVHTMDSNIVVDAKLRRFYALWCLREAYVKMTGEALLAKWLRALEFKKFRAPAAAADAGPDNSILAEGEVVTGFEIWFKEKRVQDVSMELRALGQDYMIGTAARIGSGDVTRVAFSGFKALSIEPDIFTVG